MNNTSLPRSLSRVALLASLLLPSVSLQAQVPQQSYLRNTPSEIESNDPRVNKIIEDAEKHFRLGELNLKDQKRQAAREEFDKAVDTVLESGMDVRANPRLNRYYVELVERVYRYEVPQNVPAARPAPNGATFQTVAQQDGGVQTPAPVEVGFVDQKFEPSPLDDLRTLKLDEKESDVSADDVAKLETEIKNTLDFSFTPHPLVQGFINYYQGRGRGTMETGLRRSGQYMNMARKIFREEGVPEDIVWLGQVESAWRPTARSWAAASGLWQFIPGTGARFGLRQTAYVDERNSFEKATRASARYLKWLHNRFGDWELAMGAYNTGEGNIDRAIARAGTRNFWAIYPYIAQETRNYVPNILAVILIAKNPEKYGFRNVQRMSPLAYDTVSVPSATSLQLVAALTDTSVDNIRALNPELRRDTTPPSEPYLLRVPPKRGHQMVALLKRIPVDRRTQMARVVQAAPGESWDAVASRSGVSAGSLQQWNPGVDLAKGGTLVVPAGGRVVQTLKNYERPNSAAAPAGAGLVSYTARGGETIAQVAARYGASVTEVAKLNGVTPDEPLARGRQIRVPQGKATNAPAPARRR
ncbi:MAG TPA: transglycosylase SLT domain-containing protein [Pyrinomonadaceae bacterium]|nr:transglycosylase SLT domain-containing protein [Pyrinomonadaceae bacterium]